MSDDEFTARADATQLRAALQLDESSQGHAGMIPVGGDPDPLTPYINKSILTLNISIPIFRDTSCAVTARSAWPAGSRY